MKCGTIRALSLQWCHIRAHILAVGTAVLVVCGDRVIVRDSIPKPLPQFTNTPGKSATEQPPESLQAEEPSGFVVGMHVVLHGVRFPGYALSKGMPSSRSQLSTSTSTPDFWRRRLALRITRRASLRGFFETRRYAIRSFPARAARAGFSYCTLTVSETVTF